jgi:hypothetical protein
MKCCGKNSNNLRGKISRLRRREHGPKELKTQRCNECFLDQFGAATSIKNLKWDREQSTP